MVKITCPFSKLSSERPSSEVAPASFVLRRSAVSYFLKSLNSSDFIESSSSPQYAESPPSNGTAAPVNQLDSSDAKNTAISATSSGLPILPSGIDPIRASRKALPSAEAAKSPCTNSVSTIDGQIQF